MVYSVHKIHLYKQIYDKNEEEVGNYYLVEWDGYDINSCTWEPKQNLNCDYKLNEFENSIKNQGLHDCEQCSIDGYTVYTKPCFKHHWNDKTYKHIFSNYSRTDHRRLSTIPIRFPLS